MRAKKLLELALKLEPEERFMLGDSLIKSLDEPDKKLGELWATEAEKRLAAYREGTLDGIPMEEIFKKNVASHFHPTCEMSWPGILGGLGAA